ncbi:hypothetical protein [Sphingomonas crusticola]|uniref:hypothetical protein n=1 Tax=Sphingomonas crusticola TaxID=1697973 RepID=UPI000E266524|nr:hypothetical protein [Sphingomonas crusticola]
MPHASNIIVCNGPDSPHAFDIIPLQPRNGTLDAECPVCKGYGQWNSEIDLVSFRCKRVICGRCYGAGWVETGSDPIALPDIEVTAEGYPKWVVRYLSAEEAEAIKGSVPLATKP